MSSSADSAATRLATRLAFLVAGFSVAVWAPLIPYVKARLAIDDTQLGLLLLCIGIGSLVTMPVTGVLSTRVGTKPMIVAGGLGLVVLLPLLPLASAPWLLAPALFFFGASLGTLDVAMNVHAVEVEQAADRPLMSGFHALFSIGGFLGAAFATVLLSLGLSPVSCALGASAPMLVAMLVAWPRLLRTRQGGDSPKLVMPHGIVLLLSGLAAAVFLAEGAILDWSALLIIGQKLVGAAQGGLGYMLFAIAMVIGRLSGDRVVAWLGNERVLVWGGLLAVAGFVLLLVAPVAVVALMGFLLIGLGASNIVPVLFSQAGRQTAMPAGLAVAALTTTGYTGVLVGPAGMGALAGAIGLPGAFWVLAALVALVPALGRQAAADERSSAAALPYSERI